MAPQEEIGETPHEGRKRPINEGKRPIKAMVLVDISVGCLMGYFRAEKIVKSVENWF